MSDLAQAAIVLHQEGYHDLGEAVDRVAVQRDELLAALKAIKARCHEVERKAPDALEDIWNLAKKTMAEVGQ